MSRGAVVALAALGASLAALLGIWLPWWCVLFAEVAVATGSAWWTYSRHEAAAALSWALAQDLAAMDGVIVWAVTPSGAIDYSVGGELVKHWGDDAPGGVMLPGRTLDDFGEEPIRDRGIARAWATGSASWVSDAAGVTWLSWAVRRGGRIAVLTSNAGHAVALAKRDARRRIIAEALGEVMS